MLHPPSHARRKRLRRAPALIVIGLIALLGGAGFVYWQGSRFPARSERLAGTPIELRVQAGVKPRELRAIRDGLRLGHRFTYKPLGWTVREHVEARVARTSGCRPFQPSGGEALVGEADHDFLCIDTANLHWKWLVLKDFVAATSISAHEYVHVLQADLGCLPAPSHPQYRWIVEGMADDIAWRALVVAGRASEARVRREIRDDGALSPALGPLWHYEREDGRDQEYALWHLAIRYLMREAVAAGAAPAARPEIALRHFCRRVGSGRPWRSAFRRSFGLPIEKFYARFEAARRSSTVRRLVRGSETDS